MCAARVSRPGRSVHRARGGERRQVPRGHPGEDDDRDGVSVRRNHGHDVNGRPWTARGLGRKLCPIVSPGDTMTTRAGGHDVDRLSRPRDDQPAASDGCVDAQFTSTESEASRGTCGQFDGLLLLLRPQ